MNVTCRNLTNISNRLVTKLNQTNKTKLHSAKTHQLLTDCAQNMIPILEKLNEKDYETPKKKDQTPIEEYV